MHLILASASPRRADLLRAAGFAFEVRAVEVDERVLDGEEPREYVTRLAIAKAARALEMVGPGPGEPRRRRGSAEAGRSRSRGTPVGSLDVLIIGADTAVVVDAEILGKPVDQADAERMIRRLSGRTHEVLTGVSVQTGSVRAVGVDETRVFVDRLDEEQIVWYVGSGEGLDKAGAYAIQGLASRFIRRIEGSYSNVVGLPIALVDTLIRDVLGGSRILASAR
ncbi:MAG: nucleoside triphosphate pyrophosphatase [Vicinamibacterales bacterium]